METTLTDTPLPAWPPAALILEALGRRDFDALQRCLDDDVRLRALTPRGVVEADGAVAVAATFRTWFGGDDRFDVIDASLGQVGARIYARWRVRMWPGDHRGEPRTAEQHVFTTGGNRVASIDLLCSGFQPEGTS
jgi:hypothetical protein